MTSNDFDSAFKEQLSGRIEQLTVDPRQLAMEIVRRDQWRTRILAGLSLLFWLAGTAGMLVLVIGLNQLVLFIRIADWNQAAPITRPSTTQPFVLTTWDRQMLHGTQFIHQSLPWVGGSIIALLLAALFTVLLVFSTRQATLSRINMSLLLISEQLKEMQGTSPEQIDRPRSAATSQGQIYYKESSMNKILTIALLLTVLVLGGWLTAFVVWSASASAPAPANQVPTAARIRAETPGADTRWTGYPRVSPFEAIRWDGEKPSVQVKGTWYELIAINDDPAAQIVQWCMSLDGHDWQKRFDEDLVEVLDRGGHRPGSTVTLRLRDPATSQEMVLTDVLMTEANRAAIWQARNGRP